MKASEGRIGRTFIIRLEDGDVVPDCIEQFAAEQKVQTGYAVIVGGLAGGEVVVGPRDSQAMPPEPMFLPLEGAHEVSGVGVLAPNEEGRPVLHMHAALGRSGQTITGCLRRGVSTWIMAEVALVEILGAKAVRVKDAATGFTLLQPG